MKVTSGYILAPILLAVLYEWLHIPPKVDWTPADLSKVELPPCGNPKDEVLMLFGGTSMLGKYIVNSFKSQKSICIINFSRSKCQNCDVSVKGDLRDTRLVDHVLNHYRPRSVLTAVKPPLLNIHYKVYVELNMLAMLELVKSAKRNGVQNFIYVSSIAAASHYLPHNNSSEDSPMPLYTEYEAPYDVSKRIAEDRILEMHEEGVFNTLAIRTGGIIGGEGDPYSYFRLPFIVSLNCPAIIDSNYAANIGDALVVVYDKLLAHPRVGGEIYYYTGERLPENMMAKYASKYSGKPILQIPYNLMLHVIRIWTWLRWDHDKYTTLDLLRMAIVPQSFNQSKFHTTFPEFHPKYTIEDAMRILYSR